MSNASRNPARDRLKGQRDEPIRFEKVDAVRALKDVLTSFLNPPPFKPGDLVQTREHFSQWAGAETPDLTPVMVLAVCADLSQVLDDAGLKDVEGVRIALVGPDESVTVMWEESWHFEPYDGPLPDAH